MIGLTTGITPIDLQSTVVRNPLVVSPEATLIDTIAQMANMRSCSVLLEDLPIDTAQNIIDRQLTNLLLEVRSSCVVVVEQQRVVGILTERDIVRFSAQQLPFDGLSIREVMTHPVVTLKESDFTDLCFAESLLHQHHIQHLPIVDEQEQLVGLLAHESLRRFSQPLNLLKLRQAEEVMTRDVICASPDFSMLAIAQLMTAHRVSSVVIVESGTALIGGTAQTIQRAIGIVTERDLVQLQVLGLILEHCMAEQVMSTPIFAVKPEESLLVVQQIMEQQRIRRLAVVGEQGQLLGIVTQTSLIQALNPLELYKLAEGLEKKVQSLESEKIQLLEKRTVELEQQVEIRTAALKAKVERETLLAELSNQIRASLDIQTILDTTVEQVRRVLRCDRVAIWRVEENWQTIAVAESTELSLSLLGERIDDTWFKQGHAEFFRQEHIRIISDIYSIDISDCHREMLIRIQTRAKILAPILSEDKLWGFLNASESQHARDWTLDEVQLLSALAMQLAIAIQQATTHQHLQHELTERALAEAQLKALNILNQERVIELEQTNEELQSILEALKESEKQRDAGNAQIEIERQRYQDLFDFAPDGYLVTDTAGVIRDGNERLFEQLANIPDHLIGRAFVACIAPTDYSLYYRHLEQVVSQSKVQTWEMILKPRSRDPFPVEVTVAPIYAPDQNVTELLWLIHDISERKHTEAVLQNLIEGTAATTGEGFFTAMVQYVAKALNVSYALVSELVGEELHVLAFSADGDLQPTFSFNSASTPCERAWQDGLFYCERFVQQQFPNHLDLKKMGAQSYLGVALRDNHGNPIGNLCILDQHPLQDIERIENLLNVFAARAGAELERKRATTALEQLNQALEDKVATRTAALQSSESRYRALMKGASDAIFLADAQGNLIEVNQKGVDLLGYSREELTQLHISNIHPPDVLAAAKAHFQNIMLRHTVRTLESEVLRKDGSRVPVEITGSYIELDGEKIAQGIFRDVSERVKLEAERKQAEVALRDSERRYATLAAAAPVAIFRFERALNCSYVSDRWSEMTGRPLEDALEYGWLSALHPEDRESLMLHITHQEAKIFLGSSEATYFEGRYQLQNGSIRWFYAQVTPEMDADGNALGYIGTFTDITQRKQIEAKLAESEAKFRSLVERASDIIFSNDKLGNLTYLSPQFKTLFGWNPDEFIGKPFLPFVHSEDRDLIVKDFKEDLIEKGFSHAEFRHLHQDGHYIWVRVSVSPVTDADGQLTGMQGILSDISDRKQIEYKLLESQQFIQTVLDTFPISVFWKDRNSNYLGCNRHFLKDAALKSVQELIGKTDYEMPWGKTEADHYRKDDREVMSTQTAKLRIVETQIQADGKQIWLETNKLPLLGLDGELIGVLGTYQDISHQKQAESIIRQRAEQEILLREITQRIRQSLDLQTIFDTACQEIRQLMKADRVGVFQFYANSNYDDGEFVAESFIEGVPSVIGKRVYDHCFGEKYAPLYLQGRYAAMPDILQLDQCHTDVLAKINVRSNLVIPLLCGENLWGLLCVHQCSSPRHWQQDEIDLTQQIANQLAIAIQQANLVEQLQKELIERQEAQRLLTQRNQQLAISNEELARATRLKDEFLANMSHELRTPLNAILGMTEGLIEEIFGNVNDRQTKALNTINNSGTHLLALINDILDLSKIAAGKLELSISAVSVAHLCKSSLAFVKEMANQKQIGLNTHLPSDTIIIDVDERRMRQVLINLLNNAVKFTPLGGQVTLDIHIEPTNMNLAERIPLKRQSLPDIFSHDPIDACCPFQDFALSISVIDTGIGIDLNDQAKLFQPFIQLDSTLNRKYAGTGLGLALVKQIVELHGGNVTLQSELGKGSCFTLYLPCIAAVSFQAHVSPPTTSCDPLSLPSSAEIIPPLILLAEDNEANVSTISNYLKAKNYRILLAKDGEEALRLAREDRPDLILMDVQMPGIDGLEATRLIRCDLNLAHIPIIALTALAMPGDRERCLKAGANEYMSKPVKLKGLADTIQRLLIIH